MDPTNLEVLETEILRLAALPEPPVEQARPLIGALLDALEDGRARAAEPGADGWRVHTWVKRGILLAFRAGSNREFGDDAVFHFRDREAFSTWDPNGSPREVRIVPGGSTVRRGAHLADGVVMMPPAYVNVGAWIGTGTMIDSHALVGSCAQIGSRVHLSAAAQVGGVLEPIGALPVVVEDDAFVGGGCGIYEGTRVGHGAVLAPGVVLTRALTLYDAVRGETYRATEEQGLVVPPGAVVVPGSRPAGGEHADRWGLQIAAPVIVKYRNAGTEAALALEEALR